MNGFVSPPLPAAPDAPDTLQNDGWFPDVNLTVLKDAARVDSVWTAERIREAAVIAVADVNGELEAWKVARIAEGHAGLGDVPARQIGGESVLLAYYRRAVQSFCAADLADRLRDVGTTNAGHDRADELQTTAGDHRRNGRWAISEILGLRRTRVELI